MTHPALTAVLLTALVAAPAAQAATYGAVGDGNWDDPNTWTPAGGPPGAVDDVNIGSTTPSGSATTATVTLTGDADADEVSVGRGTGTSGTLNLNGHVLFANDLLIGTSSGSGSIVHGGGHFELTDRLTVNGANSFLFDPLDRSADLAVTGGASATTAAVSNLDTDADVTGSGSLLTLGADLTLSEDLDIYGSPSVTATVDAQGHDITARDIDIGWIGWRGQVLNPGQITATRNLSISNATLTLDSTYSVGNRVYVDDGAAVTLDPVFTVLSASVGNGSTMETSTTSNLSTDVNVTGAGSLLTLGADLTLSEDLDIYGSPSVTATVDAQKHDITARNIRIGYLGWSGALLNDGALAARDLTIQDNSSVMLTGGDDVITRNLTLDDGGALTIAQAMSELTGLTLDGTSLAIDGSSLLTLAFDDVLVAGLDWAFRWANPTGGDRVAALLDFVSAGRITWTAPWGVSVFDHGDGYTYIGYTDAQVPEPAGIGLATLLAGAGWLGWRRRRASMVCRSALANGRAGFAAAA